MVLDGVGQSRRDENRGYTGVPIAAAKTHAVGYQG
jgi:hypothetical protein